MSWYGTRMTLHSVVFAHAYSSLWGRNLRPSTLWSKSKFHIIMVIWWQWDLGKLSKFYGFFKEMSQCGINMTLYSVIFVHAYHYYNEWFLLLNNGDKLS